MSSGPAVSSALFSSLFLPLGFDAASFSCSFSAYSAFSLVYCSFSSPRISLNDSYCWPRSDSNSMRSYIRYDMVDEPAVRPSFSFYSKSCTSCFIRSAKPNLGSTGGSTVGSVGIKLGIKAAFTGPGKNFIGNGGFSIGRKDGIFYGFSA